MGINPERMLELEKLISNQEFDKIRNSINNEYEEEYVDLAIKLPKLFFDVMLEIDKMSLKKSSKELIFYITKKFFIDEEIALKRLDQVWKMNNYLSESKIQEERINPRVRIKK